MATSAKNLATSNVASSCPTNISCEVQHGNNIPARKIKNTSDECKITKIIKNDNYVQNEQEGMIHICAKCGAIIKCAKDKKKGMWLTTRAMQHSKKRANAFQCHSIATEKACIKEDDNRIKVTRNLLCAGKCFSRNLTQGGNFSLKIQARKTMFIFSFLLVNNAFVCFNAINHD